MKIIRNSEKCLNMFILLISQKQISSEFTSIPKESTLPVFKLKNFNFVKTGGKLKNVSHGSNTILFKKIENKNFFVEKMNDLKKYIPESIKKAIRWKNLKWLIMNNKSKIN